MASIVSKGGWSSEEDHKLLNAVENHGTKWSVVASLVETRNSGQCAKRWNDTLNPEIDRSAWSTEEDQKLLDAVSNHGTSWTTIVKSYFPGRTALAAKNRYSHLSRSTHSRRASSPSNSSSDTSEVSTPISIESSLGSSTKDDLFISDDMDFMFADTSPESPSSRSSSSDPPTPSSSTPTDTQMLETFLINLASEAALPSPDGKLGGFSFSEDFLSSSNVQELFNPSLSPFTPDPAFSLPHIAGLNELTTTLNTDPIPSFWPQTKESAQDTTSGSPSPSEGLSITNFNIDEGAFRPDQQVAVAVAICRADNLRPTVQILIQSLAGALAQPPSPSPSKT
jgi:hypothetical protein